jgi:LmbE family N-acetylglucosaminyl deacetylase
MDASGKLLPSKEIGGVAVVSQAEARKALGVSCVQMLRLEGQKVLTRVQEGGMRHVYYPVEQVQRLIDLIDRTPPPPL